VKIEVRYFASIREALGAGETVEAGEAANVGALRDLLIGRGGAHATALARGRALRCALDRTLCEESARLKEGAEVAFFPPVTGG
jgi:molybdopterin synthase sulfur carrier subunit